MESGTLDKIQTGAKIGTGLIGTIAGLMESAKRGKLSKKQLKQIQQLQGLIMPFAQQLLNYGIDPVKFLQSPAGQAQLRPILEASSKEFEGARQSLLDTGIGAGFSPSSGMLAGPFANLLSDQAKTASDIRSGQIGQSLNFGIQGANLLAGQQGASVGALNSVLGAPNWGLQLAGASGQSLNTLMQLITLLGKRGGCWILVAVYGHDALQTRLLWAFWTNPEYGWEQRSAVGKKFVELYYKYGQRIAKIVEKQPALKAVLRFFLDRLTIKKAFPWALRVLE